MWSVLFAAEFVSTDSEFQAGGSESSEERFIFRSDLAIYVLTPVDRSVVVLFFQVDGFSVLTLGQLKGKGKGLAHRDISLHVRDIQKFEQQARANCSSSLCSSFWLRFFGLQKVSDELIDAAEVVCSTLIGCGDPVEMRELMRHAFYMILPSLQKPPICTRNFRYIHHASDNKKWIHHIFFQMI